MPPGCLQDGVVRVWDPRAKSNPARIQVHANAEGRGAVGDIAAGVGRGAWCWLTKGVCWMATLSLMGKQGPISTSQLNTYEAIAC